VKSLWSNESLNPEWINYVNISLPVPVLIKYRI
jgi:hypothetical protein